MNENARTIPVTKPEGCLEDQEVLHAPGRKGDRSLALVLRESDLNRDFTPKDRKELRQAGVFVLEWFTQNDNHLAATPTNSPISLLLRNVPSDRANDPFNNQARNVPQGSPPAAVRRMMGYHALCMLQVPLRDVLSEVQLWPV